MVKDYLQKGENKDVRYAVLRKKRVLGQPMMGLDLMVSNNNIPIMKVKGKVLGDIKFKSPLTPKEIIDDFSETYLRSLSTVDKDDIAIVIYPISYELTITHAFTNYFPNLKS